MCFRQIRHLHRGGEVMKKPRKGCDLHVQFRILSKPSKFWSEMEQRSAEPVAEHFRDSSFACAVNALHNHETKRCCHALTFNSDYAVTEN